MVMIYFQRLLYSGDDGSIYKALDRVRDQISTEILFCYKLLLLYDYYSVKQWQYTVSHAGSFSYSIASL